MVISGTVDKIHFAANNFVVFRIRNDKESVKIAAKRSTNITLQELMCIDIGLEMEIEGDYSASQYGMQFDASKFIKLQVKDLHQVKSTQDASSIGDDNNTSATPNPTSENSNDNNSQFAPSLDTIRKYLSSSLFSKVGEKKVNLLINEFGMNLLEVIENRPWELSKVRGIGKIAPVRISEDFIRNKPSMDTILFLLEIDVSLNQALRLYREYKSATRNIVLANPYQLINDIDGIGFIKADNIAQSIGIALDSPFRTKAGVIHFLKDIAGREGHTCYPAEKAIVEIAKLLKIEDNTLVENAISDLLEQRKVATIFTAEDTKFLAVADYLRQEISIAKNLNKICRNNLTYNIDSSSEIAEYELRTQRKFDDAQRKAIMEAVSQGVIVITGGPGTGKTTIIECI
ncbi:MAG: AAA family ATPase, partial [Christensenellaceae bacterium]|nr:AAA family ATPase [Christensenellaceae bacterium]